MNEILQQLMQLGPGIGAGLSGNGHAMQQFMEGFQRTQLMLQRQKSQQQQDALSMQEHDLRLQDRERNIQRQDTADAAAQQERERRLAMDSLQLPGQLAELGAGAQDPQSAQALIESAMPNLMKVFGQEAMAYGQPAVEMAQATITGRQKKQVEAYVEAALKTAYVADNPDADPELQLPEHVAKIMGRPSAKLSEVQSFAQLPVGKPAGKTRIPAAAGSFEEYSDPMTTPERKAQIEADRKRYMQADDRAPRVTVNTGGQGAYPPAQQRRIDAVIKGFDAQPVVKRTQVMSEGVNFSQALEDDTTNPADDQALIYAFAKVMDPDSVVREGEYATVQKYAQSWAQRFGFDVQRIFSNTQFLTPQARKNMKATLMTKFNVERRAYENLRNEYGRRIERITGKPGGIEELTDYGAAFPQDAAAPSTRPKRGPSPFGGQQ
jgi:hypothetical protein